MNLYPLLKSVRLIAVLSVLPFVHSCGGPDVFVETLGFPLPYATVSQMGHDLSNFSALALAANGLMLVAALLLLAKRWPHGFEKLSGLPVFLWLCVVALALKFGNFWISMPLVFAVMTVCSAPSCTHGDLMLDVLSRALVALGLLLAVAGSCQLRQREGKAPGASA